MIKSMTGFASLSHETDRATITVTVRAVNHRFLDVQIRLPQALADVEHSVRTLLQKRLARGRVEVAISVQERDATTPTVELNLEVAQALSSAIEQARGLGLVSGALTPGDLLRVPGVVTVRDQPAAAEDGDAERLAQSVEHAVEQAVGDLESMRAREGAHLGEDLESRRRLLVGLLARLGAAADAGREALEQRLHERVQELRAEGVVDQAALAQEIVRVAARSDISEEVTRFAAHLEHWRALVEGREPCGRKMDFLLQEMNREINTIGSKADGLGVPELVIEAKAELERVREQVQNVE